MVNMKENDWKEALSLVRTWGCSDDNGVAKAKALFDQYKVSHDAEEKRFLGLLLSMLFDTRRNEISEKSANRFGIKRYPGLSLGETIFCQLYEEKKEDFYWIRQLTSLYDNFDFETSYANWKKLLYVVRSEDVVKLMRLYHEKDGNDIYIAKKIDGNLRLMAVNQCDTSFLPDEVVYDGFEPLYFTEKVHFSSPVFQIKKMQEIIEFILMEIGYPPVRIEKYVAFPNENAFNIDESRYKSGGDLEHHWDGVFVSIGIRKHEGRFLLSDNLRDFYKSSMLTDYGNTLSLKLVEALKTASYFFRKAKAENFLGRLKKEDLSIIMSYKCIFE